MFPLYPVRNAKQNYLLKAGRSQSPLTFSFQVAIFLLTPDLENEKTFVQIYHTAIVCLSMCFATLSYNFF